MNYIKETAKLFDNQKVNVTKLTHRRRCLLLDKCGNGKTFSILYSFAVLKEKGLLNNLLVLTPLSAYEKEVWKADIKKFTNFKCIDIEVLQERIHNFPEKLSSYLENYDIVYGKHSHVKQISDLLESVASSPRVAVCLDEVQACKNPRSSLTIKLRMALRNAYALWGLTATVLSKNLEDTYNIINFICPWYLGSFKSFKNNYCSITEKVIGRLPNGALRKAELITGIRDEELFVKKIDPIVIRGVSTFHPKFHFVNYQLSPSEELIYRKIAHGIDIDAGLSAEDWLKQVLDDTEKPVHPLKEIAKYSSRFIYLQSAADGIISDKGTQDRQNSSKVNKLIDVIKGIVAKGESTLVYFDYYASLEVVERALINLNLPIKLLTSTGSHVLKNSDVTEAKCRQRPHVILCTKASSESASYYFINHVIFFQIPTTVATIVQMAGRILRKNTIYPDDLNLHYFQSENIDLYKLQLVSIKSYQLEVTSGEECSIPSTYKCLASHADIIEKQKKVLLWNV